MKRLEFTVPGKPVPKERVRRDGRSGRWYRPDKTGRYEGLVKLMAARAVTRDWPTHEQYGVGVRFVFPDRRKRDTDNALKAIFDGMNCVVFRDDSQVAWHLVIRSVDKHNPRAEVCVVVDDGINRPRMP